MAVQALSSMVPDDARPGRWEAALRALDHEVSADPVAGETTLVVAAVLGGVVVGASAGDSSLWLIGRGGDVDLTGRQVRRRVGSGRARPVGFLHPMIAADRLLAGTDGLFAHARRAAIVAATMEDELERAADRLAALPVLPGGGLRDDLAFALIVQPSPQSRARGSSTASNGSARTRSSPA